MKINVRCIDSWQSLTQNCFVRYGIFVRVPESEERLSDSFLAPFSGGLWLATALLPPAAASSLALFHWLGQVNGVPLGPREPGRRLGEALLYCLGVLCQQGNIFVLTTPAPHLPEKQTILRSLWCHYLIDNIIIY